MSAIEKELSIYHMTSDPSRYEVQNRWWHYWEVVLGGRKNADCINRRRDPVCGYVGVIKDVCPRCGRHEGEGVEMEKVTCFDCNGR